MLVICVYYVICDCWKHILTDSVTHATSLRSLRSSLWVVRHVKKKKKSNLSQYGVNSLVHFFTMSYSLTIFNLADLPTSWCSFFRVVWSLSLVSLSLDDISFISCVFYRLWRVSLCPVSCTSGLIWYSDTSSRDLRPSGLSMSSTTWLMKEQSTSAPYPTPCLERWVSVFLLSKLLSKVWNNYDTFNNNKNMI